MNINTAKTDSYGFHKSSPAEKNDDGFDSEQKVFKSFSRNLQFDDESFAPVNKISRLGSIAPGCSHQIVNQTIPERKVSHWVTTDSAEVMNVARVSEKFTAEEVAQHFRNTIENLIHTLRYNVIEKERCRGDQRDELIGIFIDFILYQEGLVHDRCFTVESSPDKYVAGKTISLGRVEEIESFLTTIFTEGAAAESKRDLRGLCYSLVDMLVDYLNKKKNLSDDVTPYIGYSNHKFTYQQLMKDIFPFFETLFASRGLFSELGIIFDFAVKFRQTIIDSGDDDYRGRNLLTIALRENKSDLREFFNRDVMDVIFLRRCDGIVDTLFDHCSLPNDNGVDLANRPNLKFGEELEYDLKDDCSLRYGDHLNIFLSRLSEKKFTDQRTDGERRERYGFNSTFTVIPFYDSRRWFEINCTPYHSDDQLAELSFEKVIEVTDSMRNEGFIDYSSGHKHVDAMSATQGDTGVLLAMESEIQRNPFLLRAFGNNDRIVQQDEAKWYKTFADYNPDTKPFAVKRLNRIIDRYNKRIEENHTEKTSHKASTDSEKKDRLDQFAHFYSQLVHMTTIQMGLGPIGNYCMEKYMAMSLLHITGAEKVKKLSTLEFRFFRCPKTVQEIKLINQFLQAWFGYLHQCRKDKIPLQPVPEDIKSCKDYTAVEVQLKTIDYLRKLGLNPKDYRCFWGEVRDLP
ncbi:hypothetical protein [Endozoicomonas sp. 8E]|uniref:hypothetical protein n=1 Tax=Endozoicomonas sp. 8E TaxID=3035692 RepID=UPI002938EECD|nr:hypothetical protein [Endozoicomonas sp. 8E]WOG28132.1 hypothetical protein P6910_00330 [Endozoicomonas sp. 8E]